MEVLVRSLGTVKVSDFEKDFDKVYDEYNVKSKKMGYNGNLKFEKKGGKVTIFVTINNDILPTSKEGWVSCLKIYS
jgi:hypothetical protein